eukprot:6465610-Amphidinium_carterae.1
MHIAVRADPLQKSKELQSLSGSLKSFEIIRNESQRNSTRNEKESLHLLNRKHESIQVHDINAWSSATSYNKPLCDEGGTKQGSATSTLERECRWEPKLTTPHRRLDSAIVLYASFSPLHHNEGLMLPYKTK